LFSRFVLTEVAPVTGNFLSEIALPGAFLRGSQYPDLLAIAGR
jgi:hypothetical protein